MRLIDALENYGALAERVPLRYWRPDERKSRVESHACGYCNRKAKCKHDEGRPGALRPLIHTKADSLNVVALKADIDREIDSLPHRARVLYHLRYRMAMTTPEVMAHLGLRQTSDYMAAHDYHYQAMAIRLRHWFEREAA